MNYLWSHAVNLETSALSRSTDHLQHLGSEIPRNDPKLDSMMFVRHNVAPWQEPLDMVFEPSPVWLDDSAMAVDETAKIYLRNVLGKSKSQLRDLKQDVDKRRREVEAIKTIRRNIRQGKDKRDEVEMAKAMFNAQELLHEVERQRLTAEVETHTITSTVGDVSLGAQNHKFKSQTFKVPTNCDLCGERIWGLSAKGFDCQDCGYTCHSKCELKVPAQCPGEQSKEGKKKLKAERQAASKVAPLHSNGGPPENVTELPALSRSNTMDTLSSGYAASANRSVSGKLPTDEMNTDGAGSTPPASKPATTRKNRIVAPPPTQYIAEMPGSGPSGGGSITSHPTEQRGRMNYAYQATAEGETSVDEGDEVSIVEPDGARDMVSGPYKSVDTDKIRWLWLDLCPSQRPHRRPRSNILPRNPCHASNTRAAGLILLQLFHLSHREHTRQEERSHCCPKTRSEEIEICGSIVRLRITKRCGVEHD